MTYRDGFDRLGNQLPTPKTSWPHKLIQRLSWTVVAGCIAAMLWGR